MSRVSYQAILGDGDRVPPVPLHETALATRKKDATVTVSLRVSPRQARWLKVTATSGGLSSAAAGRAALDLLMALDLDWSAIAKPGDLARAVHDLVRVRRDAGQPPA